MGRHKGAPSSRKFKSRLMPKATDGTDQVGGAPALSPTGKLFVLFGYAWVVVGPVVLYFVQSVFNLRVQEESPLVEGGAPSDATTRPMIASVI